MDENEAERQFNGIVLGAKEIERRFYGIIFDDIVLPMQAEFVARDIAIDELRHDEFFETLVRHYTFRPEFIDSPEHVIGRIALAMQFNLQAEAIEEQIWQASDNLHNFVNDYTGR